MNPARIHTSFAVGVILAAFWCSCPTCLLAETYSWHGAESDDWNNGFNWVQPPCVGICQIRPPRQNDTAIVSNPSSGIGVNLSDDVEVFSLSIGNGMRVRNEGFFLDAGGGFVTTETLLRISGFGSQLTAVGEGTPRIELYTNRFAIDNGGTLRLVAGAQVELTDIATSSIATNSQLLGNGSVHFRNLAGVAGTVLSNDGSITPLSGDLTLSAANGGEFDLDGGAGNGVLSVDDGDNVTSRNLTLTIDGRLADNFDGVMRIGKGDRIHFTQPWQLGTALGPGSLLQMNGRDNVAAISGAAMRMDDGLGRIEVQSGTARFETDLTVFAGTIEVANNTTLEFANDAFFSAAESHFDKSTAANHSMIVRGDVEIHTPDFDWDGPTGQHETFILGGLFALHGNSIDPSPTNEFHGMVNVVGDVTNAAELQVSTVLPWFLEGTMHLDARNGVAMVTGSSPMSVGDGTADGTTPSTLIVDGPSAQIDASYLEFEDDANVMLNQGAVLTVLSDVEVEGGATFSGEGMLVSRSDMHSEAGAHVGVKLVNEGALNLSGGGYFGFGTMGVQEYEQPPTGRVVMQIRDQSLGVSDQMQVTGLATLDGTLEVEWSPQSPQPNHGDEFTLLTASAVVGRFVQTFLPALALGEVWRVDYESDKVRLRVGASGDINSDEMLNCQDIDLLVAAIAGGLLGPEYDLTGDGSIDATDVTQWLADAGAANLASGDSYRVGDANLDGVVDGLDFAVWSQHKFTSAAAWCDGDFNADGRVDGHDFLLWNSHKSTTSNAQVAVPCPTACAPILIAAFALVMQRRRK